LISNAYSARLMLGNVDCEEIHMEHTSRDVGCKEIHMEHK